MSVKSVKYTDITHNSHYKSVSVQN